MGCSLCCPEYGYRVAAVGPYGVQVRRSCKIPYTLSYSDRHVIRRHWEATILAQEPHLFLKTMLNSIKDSPRLLDIISCKLFHPTLENIADWPKLKRMANGNCAFFTKQIMVNHLEEQLVRLDSQKLGTIHIQYAPYGFKPTFLDIWQKNMLKIVETLEFPKESEKRHFLKAYKTLLAFFCTLMVMEYEDSMQLIRHTEREYKNFEYSAEMV